MAIINKPYTAFPGDVIRSSQYNQNFDTVYNDYNGNIQNVNVAANAGILYSKLQTLPSAQILVGSAGNVCTPRTMSGDATIDNLGVVTITAAGASKSVPVGTILPFYDFNGLATFDATRFLYCNGAVVAIVGSPLLGQTLPDLSGRYLVGFGTDGGGDIGTAAWATAAVGNAGNTVNLQHSHTVNAHTHGPGTLQFQVFEWLAIAGLAVGNFFNNVGVNVPVTTLSTSAGAGPPGDTWKFVGAGPPPPPLGVTDYFTRSGTGVSASTAPGTDNQLSMAQDIRPRSIRVRFIMRVL